MFNKKNMLSWILMLLSFGLFALIFQYFDVVSITVWSYDFWDTFFHGDLMSFYQYAGENIRGAAHDNCAGNYFFLIPIAIWNFPAWIYVKYNEIVQITQTGLFIWTKCFYVALLIIATKGMNNIIQKITGDSGRAGLALPIMFGSTEIMMSIGMAAQDEIVYVAILIWALYYFLNGWYRWAVVLSIIAVSICPIMFLPVLAMLIFQIWRRKNGIIYSILDGILMLLPTALFGLVYRNDAFYKILKYNDRFADAFMSSSLFHLGTGDVSIPCIVLLIIYYGCYKKGRTRRDQDVILSIALIMLLYAFVMVDNFYRTFLYLPFLAIYFLSYSNSANIDGEVQILTVLNYIRVITMLQMGHPYSMGYKYISDNRITEQIFNMNKVKLMPEANWLEFLTRNKGDTFIHTLTICTNAIAIVLVCAILALALRKQEYQVLNRKISAKKTMIIYQAASLLIIVGFIITMFNAQNIYR